MAKDIFEVAAVEFGDLTIAIAGFTTCLLRQTPEFVVVRYCAPSPVTVLRCGPRGCVEPIHGSIDTSRRNQGGGAR